MRNIFIDCGANLGQGYERLKAIHPVISTCELIMFDILPNVCEFLKRRYPAASVHNKGVWCRNEVRQIQIEHATLENVNQAGHESNILNERFCISESGKKHTWSNIDLNCVDFSEFLSSSYSEADNIVLKLDIEGSEFEVLDRLIETDNLKYIKQLHIEWHHHLRSDSTRLQPVEYYNNIFQRYGINLIEG